MPSNQYCIICGHPQVTAINRAIIQCVTPTEISTVFSINRRSLYKHSRRCLELTVLDALRERRINQAVSVYDELSDQLRLAKEARTAARNWLDVNGELDLDFRPNEIMVVYEDHDDLTERGNPRKKKALLSELLDIVNAKSFGSYKTVAGYAKRTDLREYLLKAIDRCDAVIDRFARIQGEYQQDRMNENDIERIRRQIEACAQRFGTDFMAELEFFLSNQAQRLRPDIREGLREKLIGGSTLLVDAPRKT
jgi:hypothetical protein